MAEIWNLSALCRCCHIHGDFKCLDLTYSCSKTLSQVFEDTFGIKIARAPFEASYNICDNCIQHLQGAVQFKKQVLECEEKFQEYCKNELSTLSVDEIKKENGDELTYSVELIKEENEDSNDADIQYPEDDVKDSNDADVQRNEDDVKDKPHITLIEVTKSDPENVDSFTNIQNGNPTNCVREEGESKHNCKIEPVDKISANKGKRKRSIGKSELVKNTNVPHDNVNPVGDCMNNALKRRKVLKTKIKKTNPKIKQPQKKMYNKRKIQIDNTCAICENTFETQIQFRKHLADEHKSPYKCPKCIFEYIHYSFLKKHKRVHSSDFSSSTGKKMNIEPTDKLYSCDICQNKYLNQTSLSRHKKSHNGTNKKWMCHICGNSFNDKTNLNVHHLTVHEKIKPFKCTFCSKSFAASKTLKVHLRTHTGELPFQCDLCPMAFRTTASLKLHKKKHLSGKKITIRTNAIYVCRKCNQEFSHRGLYSDHLSTHPTDRPLDCDICFKSFSTKFCLNRHLALHDGVKYPCEICKQEFATKECLLRHHRRLHDVDEMSKTDNKRVACSICSRFTTDLNKHMKVHNNRQFACNYCGKSYSERNVLNRHIKQIHENYKKETQSYDCKICEKEYSHSRQLNSHMRKHKAKTVKKHEE